MQSMCRPNIPMPVQIRHTLEHILPCVFHVTEYTTSIQLGQLMHKIACEILMTNLSHVGCNWTRIDQDHLDVTRPQCLQTFTTYVYCFRFYYGVTPASPGGMHQVMLIARHCKALLIMLKSKEGKRHGSYTFTKIQPLSAYTNHKSNTQIKYTNRTNGQAS